MFGGRLRGIVSVAFTLYMTYEQDQNFVSWYFSLEMRKTAKVSKYYPSDFASDYALEITGYFDVCE